MGMLFFILFFLFLNFLDFFKVFGLGLKKSNFCFSWKLFVFVQRLVLRLEAIKGNVINHNIFSHFFCLHVINRPYQTCKFAFRENISLQNNGLLSSFVVVSDIDTFLFSKKRLADVVVGPRPLHFTYCKWFPFCVELLEKRQRFFKDGIVGAVLKHHWASGVVSAEDLVALVWGDVDNGLRNCQVDCLVFASLD